MTGFVVYGSVGWDRPWLTEHNLAHALAARHRVLFVEPAITPLTPLRYGLRDGAAAEARRLLGAGVRPADGLHVLRPLAVPPAEHPRARSASLPLLRRQIRRATARLGFERPVVIAARSIVDLLGAADERACIYLAKDLVEAGAQLIGKDARLLAAEQMRMCERADVVCAVTPRLRDTLAARGVAATVLPHGFHADLAPAYDDAPLPPDLAALPSPRIGYAGRIDGRLDFAALGAVADRFPDGSIVLIGPVSPRLDREALDALAARPNVHLLGARDRADLPAYLAHFDCSLMPYREDEWLAHGAPLKLWDALYAGAPVVGSGCLALADQPLVRFATPPGALPELVAEALAAPDAGRAARRAAALENSWTHRAQQLEALLAVRTPALAA